MDREFAVPMQRHHLGTRVQRRLTGLRVAAWSQGPWARPPRTVTRAQGFVDHADQELEPGDRTANHSVPT